jgi:hypothetical protein
MRRSHTQPLERHRELPAGPFATEPYECAWAGEAMFFVRVQESRGGEGATLRARVQVSADGIHWIDEGTAFAPISATGDWFVRVNHIGGWLRLTGAIEGPADASFNVVIHLVLKE